MSGVDLEMRASKSDVLIFLAFVSLAEHAVAQNAEGVAIVTDSELLSVAPNELAGAVEIPDLYSGKVFGEISKMRDRKGQAALDFDDLSIFAAQKEFDDASWVRLNLSDVEMGENSYIAIQSAQDGEVQVFDSSSLPEDGTTGSFNGDKLYIYTVIDPDDAVFERSLVEKGVGVDGATLGVPIERANVEFEKILGQEASVVGGEAICGVQDDRVRTDYRYVGRLMPVRCTAWLLANGKVATAAHCIDDTPAEVEFNVPQSNFIGLLNRSRIADQYRVVRSSIVMPAPHGMGNDWAIFDLEPNASTGVTAHQAQGGGYKISTGTPTGRVTVVGYGEDSGSDNQVQQAHQGEFISERVRGERDVLLKYRVDTRGGNSGSPIIGKSASGEDVVFGIHTNAGCVQGGGSNNGTGYKNKALLQASR